MSGGRAVELIDKLLQKNKGGNNDPLRRELANHLHSFGILSLSLSFSFKHFHSLTHSHIHEGVLMISAASASVASAAVASSIAEVPSAKRIEICLCRALDIRHSLPFLFFFVSFCFC